MPRPRHLWRLRTRTLPLGERTLLMGILNVTPDSFSDGGKYLAPEESQKHALKLLDDGADMLDIGGESTRPDATPLSAEEERSRVLPVISAILAARPGTILSIDTYHAETAEAALALGVEIVNDVSGLLWDPAMGAAVAAARCGLVLMHTRGRPQEWSTQPPLPPLALTKHVVAHLQARLAAAAQAGIALEHIILDPGFGFGIRGNENFSLLAQLGQLHALGRPILSGTSRKRFLRRALHDSTPEALTAADTAAHVAAILAGAHILRVHEIAPARAAASIADAVLAAG